MIKFTLPGGGFFAPPSPPAPPPPPPPVVDKKQAMLEDEATKLEAKRKAQRERESAATGNRASSLVGEVGSEDKLGA